MLFKKKSYFYNRIKFFCIALLTITMTGCSIGDSIGGAYQQMLSQPLSLTDPNLRTCVFDPNYAIVHFPMYHFPHNGHYTLDDYERVARSQFQLFHTLLDYNRSHWDISLFEESFITDTYNEAYFRSLHSGQNTADAYKRIDGKVFNTGELLRKAEFLFQNGLPRYYEHLSPAQKDFLFNLGAGFTLYLLGEIPRIHKVISYSQFQLAKANLRDITGQIRTEGNHYWVFDFREQELQKEVINFYIRNYHPRKIIFIAYGAGHNFSDEFAGRPFQSGHEICLGWVTK